MTVNPVFVFPGQGSQSVGMGKALHEEFPTVRELFAEASDILGMDLRSLCFEGPEAILQRTDNVQPAVTTVNIACLRVLIDAGIEPAATAGHSLGEYSALYAAGVFSLRDVLELVRSRGRFMQEAADESPGGMIAVMGLKRDRVEEICAEARSAGSLDVANYNAPAQTILTGDKAALDAATALAKKAGPVLVVPLKVSGPWHSKLMQGAARRMEQELASRRIAEPRIPVLSNVTGDYFRSADEIRSRLVEQIVSPVHWVTSMQRLIGEGHTLFLEVGPGHMLAGLMRDIDRSVRTLTTENPEDIRKITALFANA